MEDTCVKECVFFKKYMKGKQICPFFMSTTWTNEERTQPKILNDCAPRRSVVLQTEAFNRMQGLQQSFEAQRNRSGENTDVIVKMAAAFNEVMQGFATHLKIPYEKVLQIDVGEICDAEKIECGVQQDD